MADDEGFVEYRVTKDGKSKTVRVKRSMFAAAEATMRKRGFAFTITHVTGNAKAAAPPVASKSVPPREDELDHMLDGIAGSDPRPVKASTAESVSAPKVSSQPVQSPPVAPSTPPQPESEKHDDENGFPPADRIAALIRTARVKRNIGLAALKLGVLMLFAYSALWVILNTATLLSWVNTFLFWYVIVIELHRSQPVLMGGFWTAVAVAIAVIYFLPYAAFRKKLVVHAGGRYKTLGRVVFIRGGNAWGDPPQSMVYALWYGWRRMRHKPWVTPHEIPFGTPYYLLGGIEIPVLKADGSPDRDEKGKPLVSVERFHYAITFRRNTKGRIAGIRRPDVLFVVGRIETGMFEHRVIGDGFKVVRVARKSVDDVEHFELRKDFLTAHPRHLAPYEVEVKGGLKRSADIVSDAVLSDPELGKDVARDYTQPAFESYALQQGYQFDDRGNPILKPKEK